MSALSFATFFRTTGLAAVFSLVTGTLHAQILKSTVGLDGAQEVPPVATAGTGSAIVTVNAVTKSITVSGTYTGLSSAETAAHVHTGAFGVGGGIVISIPGTGGTSGTFSGSGVLSASQFTALLAGHLYVNVHTTLHSAGEIRGQIVNISCPAQLSTDPVLADTGGNPIRGPKINSTVEPFNVSLDCSNAGAPGAYTISINSGTLAPPTTLRFGYLWFSGQKYFTCSGTHSQNVVFCAPGAGIVLPNDATLIGIPYTVHGFCFDSTHSPGRLSSALIQVIE